MSLPLVRLEEFVGNSQLGEGLAGISLPAVCLFAGPDGIGKKTLALSLAALHLCSASGPRPCRVCPACLKIQGRNHPDVLMVDADWIKTMMTNVKKKYNPRVTTIDVARFLVREAQYRPFEAQQRFFILDEVDKLNSNASNALLKTLEEPLPTSHFLLVTAHPEMLLPTVLSRCQRFTFQSLSRVEIEAHLRSRGSDSPELRAAFAQGSIGRALELDLERLLADRNVMLGLLDGWLQKKTFGSIFKACLSKPLIDDLKDRERTLHLLGQLTLLAEDLYFLLTHQEHRVVSLDCLHQLRGLSESVDLDWIENFLYYVRQAEEDVSRYITPLVCFESLWLESLTIHA